MPIISEAKNIKIKNLAKLAKIELLPHEEDLFQKDLEMMLDFVKNIINVKIDNEISIIYNLPVYRNPLRLRKDIENKRIPKIFLKKVINNAPEVQENLFLVPKVIRNL